jgi:hypothetical protein
MTDDTANSRGTSAIAGAFRRAALTASLLACAIFSLLWLRSYRHPELLAWYTAGGKVQAAGVWRGRVTVLVSNIVVEGSAWHVDWASEWPEEGQRIWEELQGAAGKERQGAGFVMMAQTEDAFGIPGAWFYSFTAPIWVIVLITAAPGVIWARRALRRWRWRRSGRCLRCGYDLRMSPGRCPECGAEARAHDGVAEVRKTIE